MKKKEEDETMKKVQLVDKQSQKKIGFQPSQEQNSEMKQLHYTLMEQKSYDIKYNSLVIQQMASKVMDDFGGLPADLKQAKSKMADMQEQIR